MVAACHFFSYQIRLCPFLGRMKNKLYQRKQTNRKPTGIINVPDTMITNQLVHYQYLLLVLHFTCNRVGGFWVFVLFTKLHFVFMQDQFPLSRKKKYSKKMLVFCCKLCRYCYFLLSPHPVIVLSFN